MSYTVLHQANGMIPTVKDEETISVQVAQVVNRSGAVSNRIEARVYVNNPVSGYEGPTKTALVFDHVDDVDDFISALTEARQFFTTLAAAPKPVVRQAGRKPSPAAQNVRQRAAAPKAQPAKATRQRRAAIK